MGSSEWWNSRSLMCTDIAKDKFHRSPYPQDNNKEVMAFAIFIPFYLCAMIFILILLYKLFQKSKLEKGYTLIKYCYFIQSFCIFLEIWYALSGFYPICTNLWHIYPFVMFLPMNSMIIAFGLYSIFLIIRINETYLAFEMKHKYNKLPSLINSIFACQFLAMSTLIIYMCFLNGFPYVVEFRIQFGVEAIFTVIYAVLFVFLLMKYRNIIQENLAETDNSLHIKYQILEIMTIIQSILNVAWCLLSIFLFMNLNGDARILGFVYYYLAKEIIVEIIPNLILAYSMFYHENEFVSSASQNAEKIEVYFNANTSK